MHELFARDMDLPLQTIFLDLDPPALKNSRLVCRQWSDFIKRRVLGTWKKRQLAYHWRHADPTVKSVELQLNINNPEGDPLLNELAVRCPVQSLSCDDSVVVCGMADNTAKVYSIGTLALLKDLDCRPLTHFEPQLGCIGRVRSDVGQDVVATASDKGDVSVWKKLDWSCVYKKSPHGNVAVTEVKVLPDLIITAGDDGLLALLSWDGEKVSLMRKIGDGPHQPFPLPGNFLDSDGEWVLFGTRMGSLQVWSITDAEECRSISIDTPIIRSVALSYPYGVIVGYGNRVNVWDLETGEQVRKIDLGTSWEIHHNKNILVGTDITRGVFPTRHRVQIFNLHQVISPELERPLWRRTKYLENGFKQMRSCVNSSCLVAVQGNRLHVWDFGNSGNFTENPDVDSDA